MSASASAAHYVQEVGAILGTAAVTSLLSQRLRQPPVLGYLVAGMILGPHVPGIIIGGEGSVQLAHALSEFGVILLMFTIGIEFSLRKIVKIGLPAALTAVIEVGLMISLGYMIGGLFGWSSTASLFVGACLGISSTMLVAKAFEEQRLRGGFVEVVFAVLVFEDMIAILLLAILTGLASGTGLSPIDFALTVGKLLAFLLAMLAAGLLVVPRFIRGVVRIGRAETTLIAGIAVCFGMAAFASASGYSVALGAFLAGMLVSESGEGPKVEHVIQPLRDLFAAVFFISIGMTIDPVLVAQHWLPVVVLTAVVLVGKVVGVSFGSFLAGNGLRRSVRAGMSLAQIGEFSFIIAGLGLQTGAIPDYILPIMVAVSILTSITTPVMVRRSERGAEAIDRWLPDRVQTFVTFYDGWIEQLRAAPRSATAGRRVRGPLLMLTVDAALLVALLAGSSLVHWQAVEAMFQATRLSPTVIEILYVGATLTLAGVLFVGVLRRAAALARALATVVLPTRDDGKLDLGSAPRRAFTVAIELALSLVIGLPLVAVLQPFLPLSSGFAVFVLVVAALGYNVWRSIGNLDGHVRAGTELIVEVLARQGRQGSGPAAHQSLVEVAPMLPGFPDMTPVTLAATSPAIGQTLAELNLRARTGASVLSINRAGAGVVLPEANERLQVGDTLTLAGGHEAVERASALLQRGISPGD
ncbi:cation:proton antiporter [Nannocystis bainbridge]|uniref:Cation:proton antiporter n=1 Tax=Nannocystis bainbridge TaxID=2995303 RepID=A0ABT5EC11_9BACT|nr:cation:proton antiporter [Nannocystis bainbridge]MDC0722945.1 cation:proton antiporter [Nannocystis bainbridge]